MARSSTYERLKKSNGSKSDDKDLSRCIFKGLDRAAAITADLLERLDVHAVIDEYLIPALNKVGDAYERGEIFLPQLIASAQTA